MKILVLGATGNTGSEVLRQLQAMGLTPHVLLRDITKAEDLGIGAEQAIQGDFADRASLQKACAGIDRIYLATPVHPDSETWIANVVDAAKQNGVKRIVKLSGFGADEQAGSEIIRGHARTDSLIKHSGIEYTLLQPNSFFQNLYGSLPTIVDHRKFYLPLGDAAQSVIDIRDVAAVAVAALTEDGHANQVYRLSGPRALSYAEQAAILSRAADTEIEYVAISKDDAKRAMREAGMGEWMADKLAEILVWFREFGYDEVTDDVEKVTGQPARSFEDFAVEFAGAINA